MIKSLNPEFTPGSILDLGAGAGSATWAALNVFPTIARLTMVERDREMSAIAGRLHANAFPETMHESVKGTLDGMPTLEAHDVVVFSYSLGEIRADARQQILKAAWNATRELIVVIESGSTHGFACVLGARKQLIEDHAHMVAPCPHTSDCPMLAPDWCHFGARIERTRLHREAKGGALPYEDEKFSFVAASRNPLVTTSARIVRRPLARKGHIRLDLCTLEGLTRPTISKKHPEQFRQARHAEWGDSWDLSSD